MNIITSGLIPPMIKPKPTLENSSSDQIATFSQLLHAGVPDTDPGVLSPQQMLVRQADTLGMTVGVDLSAKVAGAVSQSINKLVNMA